MPSAGKAGTGKAQIDDVELHRYLYGSHSAYTQESIDFMENGAKDPAEISDGDGLPFEVQHMMEEFYKQNPLSKVYAEVWNKEHPEDKFEDKLAKTDDEETTSAILRFGYEDIKDLDIDKEINNAINEFVKSQEGVDLAELEEGEVDVDEMFDENDDMKEEYIEKYTEEAKEYLRKHLKEEYHEMMANHPDKE